MDALKFRKSLLRISNQLSRQDLDYIKFLSEDDVPRSKMERVRSGTDLFNALEERGKLSSKNLGFLVQILTAINRSKLIKDEGFVIPPSTLQVAGARGQISQQTLQFMFRECLVKIAMGLQSTEINDLVFVFQPKLQVSPDTVFSATNLFTLLMQRQILTTSDLRTLHDSLCQLQRHDLVRLINEFLAKTGQQPYSTVGQGMIVDHPGRTGNQNQTPVEETSPAVFHPDPSHGNLGAHAPTQYYTAQAPGTVGGGYPPHYHHQMTGLSSAGTCTSLQSGMYRSVSTPSSTTMDYPPGGGGGVYTPGPVQTQEPQFRLNAMDTSAPPTGVIAPQQYPLPFAPECPLQHVDLLRQHSGDVKPFGFDFNVFDKFSKPNEPVSSPPSMQEVQQQRLLEDLAMKQGELKRKEEEIERLRVALEEANSDKSKVYTDKLGEAEQYKKNIRDLESMLRTKNEEVNGLFCELQLFHQQMENIQAAKPFDEKEFYRMDKNPHGMCVIINNHQFHHPTDPDKAHLNRGGAEVDQKNLKLTFEYLRYVVEVYENLTHVQMTDLMMTMAQRNHANYDSFICCILTHGEENKVHGADSIPVSLFDMTGVMKLCKTLVNKPKMFFIQACRGDLEDKGHQLEEEVIQRDSGGKQPPSTHTIPQEADFFFGYATPLGNAAYRSRRHGSWYISELCKVLTRHAYTSNLSTMMRKVNDNICQAFTKEGYKQTAEFVDRLRKGVHFFHFSKVQQQQQLPQHTQPPAH